MDTPVDKILIFIIEDDPDDQELIKLAFEKGSMPVSLQFSNNSTEALSFLLNCTLEEKPDIIVSDYNIPMMNGEELLNKLQLDHRYAQTPKVILSTAASPTAIQNCLANGAARYIVKPYSFDGLISIVTGIIALHQPKN